MKTIDESTKNLGKKITEATMASLREETELNEGPIGRALSGIGNAAMAAMGSGTARGKQKQQAAAQHLMQKWQEFTAINNKPWNQDNLLYFFAKMFGDEQAANISNLLFPAKAKAQRVRKPKSNPNASPQAAVAPNPTPNTTPNGAAVRPNPNASPQAANAAPQIPTMAAESIQEAAAPQQPAAPQPVYTKETIYKLFYVLAGKLLDSGGMTVGDSQWTKKLNKFFGVASTGSEDNDRNEYGNTNTNKDFNPQTKIDLRKLAYFLNDYKVDATITKEVLDLARNSTTVRGLMLQMARAKIDSGTASLAVIDAHS